MKKRNDFPDFVPENDDFAYQDGHPDDPQGDYPDEYDPNWADDDDPVEVAGQADMFAHEDFWNASADDSEALPEEERESVSNYETLQEAEKRLEELRRLAEINAVEQEIADIGEVTEEKKEQIQNVREKYEALSEEEKGMVSNSDILREAEERLEKLKLLAIVGTWKSSIVGITLVYSFKEDGTYENYAQNPIGLKLSVQGGTYSYDGETVTLYHDGKENVFPVMITENSLIIMATDNNPIGDMIYTRVD